MRKSLIWVSLVVLAASAPALADEIVYFTNGTTMVIETHEVDEATGNLRVQLPGAGMMEFPLDQVTKIEDARGAVSIPGQSANVVVRGRNHRIEGSRPARHRREEWQPTLGSKAPDNEFGVSSGIVTTRPFGADATPNKRQISVTGRRDLNRVDNSRRTRNSGSSSFRPGARRVITAPNQGTRRQPPVAVEARK
jgi:hypothetical protein